MKDNKDVFISYGRRESKAFATWLYEALTAQGYNVWFDQNDIPLAVDFQDEIDAGIAQAHNFIFIIAPHSVQSLYCQKEIELALRFQKRIIPILHVEPRNSEEWEQLHPEIQRINWVYARQKEDENLPLAAWEDIDDRQKALADIQTLFEKDKVYVHQHTEILNQALEWIRHDRDSQYLSIGEEREAHEKWLLTDFGARQAPCLPTFLHAEFISEARKNAENLMTDVFVSYAAEEKFVREEVRLTLAHRAITTWTHDRDIQTGQDFNRAIYTGVEQADNFIFLISEKSTHSKHCVRELNRALELNKRIIPLLIDPHAAYDIPPQIRNLQYITFYGEHKEEGIRRLIKELHKDESYYHTHKVILVQALKWERQKQNESILLKGYNLQNAQAWAKIGQKMGAHRPTTLHEQFIEQSLLMEGKRQNEVFISYSRKDSDFVRRINETLQIHGKITWFDQESIASGVDFRHEIFQGIESSENFLFILSPDAVESPFCEDEVAHAVGLNKRIIPVLWRGTDPDKMPEALSQLQWIDFRKGLSDFNASFSELIRTLDLDREHVAAHTKWLREALEWRESKKNPDYLLRGAEFAMLDSWYKEAVEQDKMPRPGVLISSFRDECEKFIIAQEEKEQRVKEELLRLEQARAREAEERVRKQKFYLSLLAMLLVIAVAVGGVAVFQFTRAERAKRQAEISLEDANQQRDLALEAQKRAAIERDRADANYRELQLSKKAEEDALKRAGLFERIQLEVQSELAKAKAEAELQRLREKQRQQNIKLLKQSQQEVKRRLESVKARLLTRIRKTAEVGLMRENVRREMELFVNEEFDKVIEGK